MSARTGLSLCLLWCALALAALLVLLHLARERAHTLAALDRSRQQSLDLQGQFEAAEASRQRVRQWAADYRWMQEHHLLDEERRLDWVEALAEAAEASGAHLSLRYSIAPQRDFEGQLASPDAFRLRASRMRLHVDALHEEVWLTLMDELPRRARAWYAVHSCRLRLVVVGNESRFPLKADCELDWFSLRPPTASPPNKEKFSEGVQ